MKWISSTHCSICDIRCPQITNTTEHNNSITNQTAYDDFPTGVARRPRAARNGIVCCCVLRAACSVQPSYGARPTMHCQWGWLSSFLSMVTLTFDLWPLTIHRRHRRKKWWTRILKFEFCDFWEFFEIFKKASRGPFAADLDHYGRGQTRSE